ncbi:MAG: DUF948 domain-containing protein [Candidatus Gastranaerophilaceae bacterium]
MDMSQIALNQGLTFLAWATGIVVIIVAGFLVKLLIDLSALAKNVNETSVLLNNELKPTLKELNETLASINAIVKSTDKGVDNFKTAVERTFGKTKLISESIFGGIIKGFTTVYSMFAKAKR